MHQTSSELNIFFEPIGTVGGNLKINRRRDLKTMLLTNHIAAFLLAQNSKIQTFVYFFYSYNTCVFK